MATVDFVRTVADGTVGTVPVVYQYWQLWCQPVRMDGTGTATEQLMGCSLCYFWYNFPWLLAATRTSVTCLHNTDWVEWAWSHKQENNKCCRFVYSIWLIYENVYKHKLRVRQKEQTSCVSLSCNSSSKELRLQNWQFVVSRDDVGQAEEMSAESTDNTGTYWNKKQMSRFWGQLPDKLRVGARVLCTKV